MNEEKTSTDSGELFDVVDAEDRIIGQAPRHEVHARRLLHRAVHVLIHNAAGHFFLQRRSLTKDTFPGCWDSSCTGHVDAGEDYLSAAWRELSEELGWCDRTPTLRPLLKLAACPETGFEFIQIYLAGPLAGPFTLHPGEISEGCWLAPGELEVQLKASPNCFAGSMRHLWRHHHAEILAAVG
jgi:isopentenyl-diphosphate delta-isomerase